MFLQVQTRPLVYRMYHLNGAGKRHQKLPMEDIDDDPPDYEIVTNEADENLELPSYDEAVDNSNVHRWHEALAQSVNITSQL